MSASLLLLSWSLAFGQRASFHHVHLNARDPVSAIRFYTSKFDCQASTFAGKPAVWTHHCWLLFEKAKRMASPADSPIWHIGWGAEDMPSAYQKQLASGTKFHTPLTDISDLANFKGFYFAYIEGPDQALIEINTAPHHQFGHVHLFSQDPHQAADWYEKHFGVKARKSRPEPRIYRNFQVGPSASFQIGRVNVILFPAGYRGHSRFRSSRGTVFDHVAFSVEDLAAAFQQMQTSGVRILAGPKRIRGSQQRSFFVEGPDQIVIEVVEGHAKQP
ncbi:MAG: VOC family protein [Bryobacteraceae bacterium]|nr:VOC family protein [Bryobacteraceae bacterium]MDW8377165.1 VOC family protein [Bryobacterales bacterium]